MWSRHRSAFERNVREYVEPWRRIPFRGQQKCIDHVLIKGLLKNGSCGTESHGGSAGSSQLDPGATTRVVRMPFRWIHSCHRDDAVDVRAKLYIHLGRVALPELVSRRYSDKGPLPHGVVERRLDHWGGWAGAAEAHIQHLRSVIDGIPDSSGDQVISSGVRSAEDLIPISVDDLHGHQ